MSGPTRAPTQKLMLKDLGDGLILRRATPEDAEALSDFNAVVNSLTDQPDEQVRAWTGDLISGRLPNFNPEDFTIVEDTKAGAIVSTLNLISQTWSYGGIEFGAGRIELVGTHPEYRRRGPGCAPPNGRRARVGAHSGVKRSRALLGFLGSMASLATNRRSSIGNGAAAPVTRPTYRT